MDEQQINDIEIPETLKKYEKKIRALLYYQHIEKKKGVSLRWAGLHVYNVTKQYEVINDNKAINIFCDKFKDLEPQVDINIDEHSRQAIIEKLKQAVTNEDIRRLEGIAKLRGYYDKATSELDTSKPIYIVTGSRRIRNNTTTVKPSNVTTTTPINNDT